MVAFLGSDLVFDASVSMAPTMGKHEPVSATVLLSPLWP